MLFHLLVIQPSPFLPGMFIKSTCMQIILFLPQKALQAAKFNLVFGDKPFLG